MGKKIRVAFMLTPVEFGGAERVCLTLLKHINRERFDIVPILLTRPWEKDNQFVREIAKEGYDICEIPVALTETGDYSRIARCFKLVWRMLRSQDFDLLHTNGYFADIVGLPIARLINLPSVSTCHGYIGTTWNLRLYNALDRIALKLGGQVLAVSEAIRQDLVDFGLNPASVRVVANGVDSSENSDLSDSSREAIRMRHGICDTDFVVGYVGRLSAEKGVNYLLSACVDLVGKGVPLKIVIVGDGPERNELERLSRELGLGDRVIFAGFQEDVVEWLGSMDLFVLPSLTEGTPMALLEAMTHRVPIVASAVGGVPDVIKHGENGFLVTPGRVDEISNAALDMFGDPVVRKMFARNALMSVRTRYGVEQWINQIEIEYQSLSRRSARNKEKPS